MKHTQFSLGIMAVTIAVILTPVAGASVLLEPYLGYHTGSATQGSVSANASTSSDTLSGVSYGGRLGYENLGFMIGADVMSGNWSLATTPSTSVTPTDIGAFVGFEFPMLLRVYGVYNFDSTQKFTQNSNTTTFDGSGIKLGVGFKMLPLLSINVEYMTHTFTKTSSASLGTDGKDSMYGLTISVPLTF